MQVEIEDVLGVIMQLNINRCSYTTYDQGVQECARQEIVRGLAQHYDIKYQLEPQGINLFPVKGTRA